MKLVCLNTWGATQGQLFFDYVEQQAKTTDIFCFQEIFSSTSLNPEISSGAVVQLYEKLVTLLSNYNGYFLERSNGFDYTHKVDFPLKHGLAMFVKKDISIEEVKSVQIKEGLIDENDPVEGYLLLQIAKLAVQDKIFSVLNYHGIAKPGTKIDNEHRINASNKIKEVWNNLETKANILCGDFNLNPDTQSVKILESVGQNLISKFQIENTRNEISWKRYNNKQYFADYVFISPEVKVSNFKVPYSLVSDHLPMELEFQI